MKFQMKAALLCTMLAVSLLSGCGDTTARNSTDIIQTETDTTQQTVIGSETDCLADQEGTFNEDVFRQICSDIHIKDADISLPANLDDLGEHFSVEYFMVDKENALLTYELKYDDVYVGFLLFDGTEELNEKDLHSNLFYSMSIEAKYEENMSVGGITMNDPIEKVYASFGKPEAPGFDMGSDGSGRCQYGIKDRQYISYVYRDGLISSVVIDAHN